MQRANTMFEHAHNNMMKVVDSHMSNFGMDMDFKMPKFGGNGIFGKGNSMMSIFDDMDSSNKLFNHLLF